MPTLPGDKDPLTQPGGWSGILSLRKTAIQPEEGASLLDSAFAAGEEALLASPLSSISRMDELRIAARTGQQLTGDDARARIDSAGLKGHLTVPDQGVTQDYLDILIDRKQEEIRRAELIASAPQGFGPGAARFVAGFAASMFDPLNVATAFVPVIGQARYLKWLGASGGLAGRTAVRAGVGATEGLAGAALVEPLVSMAKDEEQADYDLNDSLANIAFGTVFGGGLHVMGGTGADLYRRVRGATNPWDLPELKAGREAHAAVYDDIQSQLMAAGRGADEAAANASLVASAFRSLSEVTGRSVDELYAEFGPRISFAREGEAAYAQGPSLSVAEEIADSIAGIRRYDQAAYHGSPHDFDKFSLDKIGTGEGAQAYGWGLYFAENPGVAGMYHRNLAGAPAIKSMRLGGLLLNDTNHFDYSPRGNSNYENVRSTLAETLMLQEENIRAAGSNESFQKLVLKELDARIKQLEDEWPEGVEAAKKLRADLAKPGAVSIRLAKAPGGVYQVDIPDSATARMLDWDKPLSEQPESVRKAAIEAFKKIGLPLDEAGVPLYVRRDPTGESIYTTIQSSMISKTGGVEQGSGELASKMFRDLGIPGIRYLDQGSRRPGDGSGPQTRNLVVFDDSIVKITHKDGTPVTAAERKGFLQQRGQDKRGSIDLAKGRRVNITLFQKADRSTFVHETGHLFLEVMDSLASKTDAPEALKADLAKAREWMGLKDGEAIGEKHHEQFARGFEAYLREGKAPTPKLKKIFERFRDWLVGIYKDIRALDVTLSDDVRGVYDRLIAGYDAAKKAELAGPVKREAALKAAIAQTVRGKQVNSAEPIINGDAKAAKQAAQSEVDALAEPPPEPMRVVDDDTGIEAANESLNEISARIKASGDERAILQLDELDEITDQAKTWAKVVKGLAPCVGGTDG